MKRAASLMLTSLFLFLLPATYAQTTREAGPDPAEWVPEDALVYVGVTDTAQLWKDFQNSAAYKMMQDKEVTEMPAVAGVWGTMAEKIKQRLALLLDTEADSLKNPLAGPLAFYLTAPPGAGWTGVEPVIIAGVGDQPLMNQYLEAALARMKAAAATYETVSAGGQTIHVFAGGKASESQDGKSEDDDSDFEEGAPGRMGLFQDPSAFLNQALDGLLAAEKLPEKMAICLAGERLIVSATPDRVKSALARERESKSLASTEDHKLLLSSLKPIGQIRVLVNLPRLFEIARSEAKGESADSLRQTFNIIGASSLRGVVGHCRVGSKSYDSKIEVLFLMSGERTGLARLLSMENAPVEAPAWTTADTTAFASLNVDPPKLVDEVLRMMASNDPKAAEEARASLEQVPMPPDNQPVNMRKDLIDHLAGPLTAGFEIARPAGPGSLRGMFSLGHRNRDSITRVMGPLLGEAKPRDVRGTPVYTEPQMGGTLAIGSDRLLFGSQALVESTLAASASGGLTEDPNFRRAKRVVPKDAWCVIYIDQRKLMDGLVELANKKEQMMGDPMAGMVLSMLQAGGMDFSDEKQNKKMLQYSAPGIFTIATTTEGVQVTLVGLNPKEESDQP